MLLAVILENHNLLQARCWRPRHCCMDQSQNTVQVRWRQIDALTAASCMLKRALPLQPDMLHDYK